MLLCSSPSSNHAHITIPNDIKGTLPPLQQKESLENINFQGFLCYIVFVLYIRFCLIPLKQESYYCEYSYSAEQ